MAQRQRRTYGWVVTLAGSALIGWSIYHLVRGENCDGVTIECPPDWIPATLLLGVVASFAGVFLARSLLAVAPVVAAVAAGLVIGASGSEDAGEVAFWAGFMVVMAVLPLVLVKVLTKILTTRGGNELEQRLLEEGATAVGTLMSVTDTGVTVNMNPQVRLTLLIEPEDGSPPFEGIKTTTVSRVRLPHEGQRFPVWYDRNDPTRFAVILSLDEDADPEIRRRYELARSRDPGLAWDAAADPDDDQPGGDDDPLSQLERLAALWQAGALSDDEFTRQKAMLLGTRPTGRNQPPVMPPPPPW